MPEQTNLIKVTLSCPSIWDKYHGQHWRMFIFFSLLDSTGGFALYLPVAMVSPDTGALPMMVFFFYSCTPLIQLLWNRKLRLADLRANQLRFIEHTFGKKSQVFKHNVCIYLQQAIPSLNGCGSLLPQSHFCYLQPQSEDLKAEETEGTAKMSHPSVYSVWDEAAYYFWTSKTRHQVITEKLSELRHDRAEAPTCRKREQRFIVLAHSHSEYITYWKQGQIY